MIAELKDLSLIELYNHPSVNRVSEFAQVVRDLDIEDLAQKYKDLVKTAPRRYETGKKYFVGHTRFQANEGSNRKEEILAGELFNYCQDGNSFTLPDNRNLKIIDYQFPLKARQGDKGIGKIDLLGIVDDSIPSVIELKVDQDGGGKPDTPLRALLEGLAYSAIIEANKEEIGDEARGNFGITLKGISPYLVVLGPDKYWAYFINKKSAGEWIQPIHHLAMQLSKHSLPFISFISLSTFTFDVENKPTIGDQVHFQPPF